MRILFIAPFRPSPLRIRPLLVMRLLATKHHVDGLMLDVDGNSPNEHIGSSWSAYPVTFADRLRALPRMFDVAFPLQSIAVSSAALRAAVQAAVAGTEYDVIHVQHVRALQFVPPSVYGRTVFDAVDCVSQLFRQGAAYQRSPKDLLFMFESRRVARCESKYLKLLPITVVASERDRTGLASLAPHARIAVLPNAVDLDRFVPGSEPRRNDTVVFSGKMSYHANFVGAEWLLTRVWPEVLRRHPSARLVLAGANPNKQLMRSAAPSVEVTGYVRDMSRTLSSATVAVAPLQYAVGVQNKVLEALATATPVVATTCAVGDLGLTHGKDVLVADDPIAFARAITQVLTSPVLARSIGAAGLSYVKSHHSASAIVSALESIYREVAHQEARVPA